MQKKDFHSVAVRLAFRFSILVTIAVILLSFSFIAMLNLIVQNQKSEELYRAVKIIEKGIKESENSKIILEYEKIQLPYFISYVVYEKSQNGENLIIGTNDPYLPILPLTKKKAKKYLEKDFFIDGDLNIFYFTEIFKNQKKSSQIIIETSLNMETDSFTRMSKQVPKNILFFIPPVLILSFFISLFITKRTILPVKKITATAKKLSFSNLDTLLPVSKNDDEIDDLANTFNNLFKRLKSDFERERQFTSDVSHELKTPIAVILGQTNLLKRWGKNDSVQLEKSLDSIIKEAKSMSNIIENLLQMSRIENGKIKPKLENFRIFDLFERVKEEVFSIDSEIQFEINCDEKKYIISDKELLHQVFMIIVSNSIKYCKAANVFPVKIICSFTRESEILKISIKDNGIGFDEKTKLHVFERFYRGDEAHSRSAGGSGLGLSIAKTIINSMDGSIFAENNQGAEIIILLKE